MPVFIFKATVNFSFLHCCWVVFFLNCSSMRKTALMRGKTMQPQKHYSGSGSSSSTLQIFQTREILEASWIPTEEVKLHTQQAHTSGSARAAASAPERLFEPRSPPGRFGSHAAPLLLAWGSLE